METTTITKPVVKRSPKVVAFRPVITRRLFAAVAECKKLYQRTGGNASADYCEYCGDLCWKGKER